MRLMTPALLAAIATYFAGPLAAEDLSPGAAATKAELAARIGVDPNDHTLRDLSALSCRLSGAENDAEKQRLLQEFTDADLTPPPAERAGHDQMAQALGLDPAAFTTAQLVLMRDLASDETCNVPDPAAYATSGERLTPVSAGAKNQLATSMGVDPTDYSLAELVRMHESEDN